MRISPLIALGALFGSSSARHKEELHNRHVTRANIDYSKGNAPSGNILPPIAEPHIQPQGAIDNPTGGSKRWWALQLRFSMPELSLWSSEARHDEVGPETPGVSNRAFLNFKAKPFGRLSVGSQSTKSSKNARRSTPGLIDENHLGSLGANSTSLEDFHLNPVGSDDEEAPSAQKPKSKRFVETVTDKPKKRSRDTAASEAGDIGEEALLPASKKAKRESTNWKETRKRIHGPLETI